MNKNLEMAEMQDRKQDCNIKQIIEDTVNCTVLKLKMHGMISDNRKTAHEKTEEILRNYNTFKKNGEQPYTKKIVETVDIALEEIRGDPYREIVPLIYFEGKTREDVAEYFNTTVTTISRNKRRLINVLKVRLFSDDVIHELFL